MKQLVLFRHGKSDRPEGIADYERPLAERGKRTVPVMGRWLAEAGLDADLALVSPARRTRESWALLKGCLRRDVPMHLDERIYEAAASGLLAVIRETPDDVTTLLIVGHNPGLQDLAIRLCDGKSRASLEKLQAKFPTAAVARIRFPMLHHWRDAAEGSAMLEDFKTPRSLEGG